MLESVDDVLDHDPRPVRKRFIGVDPRADLFDLAYVGDGAHFTQELDVIKVGLGPSREGLHGQDMVGDTTVTRKSGWSKMRRAFSSLARGRYAVAWSLSHQRGRPISSATSTGRPVNLLARLEQCIDVAGRKTRSIAEDHRRTAEDVDLAHGIVPPQQLGQAEESVSQLDPVDGLRHGQARSRAPEPIKMPRIRNAPGECTSASARTAGRSTGNHHWSRKRSSS